MQRLLAVAILLALGYLAAPRLGPFLSRFAAPSADSGSTGEVGDGEYCVERAWDVNLELGQALRQAGPAPGGASDWSDARWRVENEISEAASLCSCPAEACSIAARALAEMTQQLQDIDMLAQGTASGYANPARRQERIVDLLEEAESNL